MQWVELPGWAPGRPWGSGQVHEAGKAVAVCLICVLKGGFEGGVIGACAIGIDAGDLNNKTGGGKWLKSSEAAGGAGHWLCWVVEGLPSGCGVRGLPTAWQAPRGPGAEAPEGISPPMC